MSTKSENQDTPKFKRGINNQLFIDKLNRLASDSNSFWSKMIADRDLFVAIRNEYLSIYYKGTSICTLSFEKGKVIGKTHYKYLLEPDLDEYVKSTDGIFQIKTPDKKFIAQLSDIKKIKKAASVYAGEEKIGVQSITRKKADIIDVEITFKGQGEEEKDTNRIDYAGLELDAKSHIKLVFYEAKRFSNNEIRSSKQPKVLTQMSYYEEALKKHEQELIDSYLLVCKNLKDLNIIKAESLIDCVANKQELSINLQPRLIIFGFDQDQKDGAVWEPHKQKLISSLGRKRLLLVGKH